MRPRARCDSLWPVILPLSVPLWAEEENTFLSRVWERPLKNSCQQTTISEHGVSAMVNSGLWDHTGQGVKGTVKATAHAMFPRRRVAWTVYLHLDKDMLRVWSHSSVHLGQRIAFMDITGAVAPEKSKEHGSSGRTWIRGVQRDKWQHTESTRSMKYCTVQTKASYCNSAWKYSATHLSGLWIDR